MPFRAFFMELVARNTLNLRITMAQVHVRSFQHKVARNFGFK